MSVTTDTLELTAAELAACKDAVRKMAYFNWLDAGQPDYGDLDFWLRADANGSTIIVSPVEHSPPRDRSQTITFGNHLPSTHNIRNQDR